MTTERPKGPKGEVLDQVERDGHATVHDLVESAGIWSPDSIHIWLRDLEESGHLDSEANNYEEYGTTRRVWFPAEEADDDD